MGGERLVYLMSPVRQVTPEQSEIISQHAKALEEEGSRVFNPVDDAPQDDVTGYNIVMAELNFMKKAADEGGRVDILWNMGGKPSEGSRVDLGIALALNMKINLVTTFNKDVPFGPQLGYKIIKEMTGENESKRLCKFIGIMLSEMEQSGEVSIDWNVVMSGEDEEWQRIKLGLALGYMAQNPNFKIRLGKITGTDPSDKKSYPKVIKEIEKKSEFTLD